MKPVEINNNQILQTVDKYAFPKRVTEDMKRNFFNMRWSFNRTHKDYEENRINNWFPKNWTFVYLKSEETGEKREAEYYFKRNNIAWAYDWKDVYTVSSGGTLFWERTNFSDAGDLETCFLIRKFKPSE